MLRDGGALPGEGKRVASSLLEQGDWSGAHGDGRAQDLAPCGTAPRHHPADRYPHHLQSSGSRARDCCDPPIASKIVSNWVAATPRLSSVTRSLSCSPARENWKANLVTDSPPMASTAVTYASRCSAYLAATALSASPLP